MSLVLLAFRGPPSGRSTICFLKAPGNVRFSCASGRLLKNGRQQKKVVGRLPLGASLPASAVWQAARVTTFAPLSAPEGKGRPVANMVKGKDMEWRSTALEWRRLPRFYMELSKVRLTGLVVVTAMAGYAMAPGAFSAATLALVTGGTLLTSSAANAINQWLEVPYDSQMARTAARPLVTGGTLLTSSAANAINQWLEVPYDSQMARTAARPLVRARVSPLHAATFATVCASSGVGLLYLASPLAAALGAANLLLYTAVYTPMKRVTIANTWVGAVVGGVPPLMGWAAATGSLAPGAWLLAALLYAWQFPHFNALSWNLRKDYARAGYRIMAVTHPDLTRRVALRYSLVLAALPVVTSACDVTTWMYAIDSLPVNAYLVYLSWRFYREQESGSARRLTRFSYLQLTAGIILMLLAKEHYLPEPEPEPTAEREPEPAAGRRRTLRDWCIGEPLILRGWDLGRLMAVAERGDAARRPDAGQDSDLSGQDSVRSGQVGPLTDCPPAGQDSVRSEQGPPGA